MVGAVVTPDGDGAVCSPDGVLAAVLPDSRVGTPAVVDSAGGVVASPGAMPATSKSVKQSVEVSGAHSTGGLELVLMLLASCGRCDA